jgi:hypothetical protein
MTAPTVMRSLAIKFGLFGSDYRLTPRFFTLIPIVEKLADGMVWIFRWSVRLTPDASSTGFCHWTSLELRICMVTHGIQTLKGTRLWPRNWRLLFLTRVLTPLQIKLGGNVRGRVRIRLLLDSRRPRPACGVAWKSRNQSTKSVAAPDELQVGADDVLAHFSGHAWSPSAGNAPSLAATSELGGAGGNSGNSFKAFPLREAL